MAELAFVFAVIVSKDKILEFFYEHKGFLHIYLAYIIIILASIIANYNNLSLLRLAMSLVLIASPLTIGIGCKIKQNTFKKIIIISLLITGLYSVLQWTVGIEATKIPGLNIAYGDTFADKPIGYGFNGREALKMPSTYQNGNGVALFFLLAIFFVFTIKTKKKFWKALAILLGAIGIILSGSRTALIPFVLLIPYAINKIYGILQKRNQKITLIIFLIIGIGAGVFYITYSNSELIEYMYDRYVVQTISDPTGSGRVTQIQSVVSYIVGQDFLGVLRNLIIGADWSEAFFSEGIFNIVSYYGVIEAIIFIILLVYPIVKLYKNNKIEVLGLISVFIAFMVDSSFNYPPGLMNYFLIAGVLFQRQKMKLKEEENNKEKELKL